MGRSNQFLFPFYKQHIKPKGDVALLGFTENGLFDGDLYDRSLNNWNINSEWELEKKYDTIISLRCPYFSRNPEDFIKRCYENLNEGGKLYVDWGLGDHWRFKNYKLGWIKDGEHEYAYGENNFLWSTVWDDSFCAHPDFELFVARTAKYGYKENIKQSIFKEIPKVLKINTIKKYFDISYNIRALWPDRPQLYILISGVKKSKGNET